MVFSQVLNLVLNNMITKYLFWSLKRISYVIRYVTQYDLVLNNGIETNTHSYTTAFKNLNFFKNLQVNLEWFCFSVIFLVTIVCTNLVRWATKRKWHLYKHSWHTLYIYMEEDIRSYVNLVHLWRNNQNKQRTKRSRFWIFNFYLELKT